MIGAIVNESYKILSRLGKGGFGIVYLAEDNLAKRKVAIKALLEKESLDQSLLIREIEFLASLKHSSIVTFHHHFFHGGILYLVMEYCSGGNLDVLIESKNKLDIDESLKISVNICEVFEFIHSKNIVHRDIKPNNILIDNDGIIKVSDFGIANTHGGTTIYLAPEVYSAEYISSKDPRIDIYALGLTLLEMVTGTNPFWNSNGQDIIAKKINHNFIPTSLPEWLQSIILKATHPIPELRFQTATEFKLSLISKTVPYVINKERIIVDRIFEIAARNLKNKNWQKSNKFIEQGLEKEGNSAFGLMVAGKYCIKIHKLNRAKEYLEQAIKINPSVSIKKELAEINLANGNYAIAVSLLQNHLQLNPTDWEAFNILIECFFRLGRFENALEIIESVIKEAKQDCFWNNWYLIKYCLGGDFIQLIREVAQYIKNQHFIRTNFQIMKDIIEARIDNKEIQNKLLYQDYRFNNNYTKNTIVLENNNGNRKEFSKPIITLGRNIENDFCVENNSVSRKHCVIINHLKDVWIYDSGSKFGIYVDGEKIFRKQFLLGKHQIKIGDYSFDLYTSNEIML